MFQGLYYLNKEEKLREKIKQYKLRRKLNCLFEIMFFNQECLVNVSNYQEFIIFFNIFLIKQFLNNLIEFQKKILLFEN